MEYCANCIFSIWPVLLLLPNLFMAGIQHKWKTLGVPFGFMYSLNVHLFCGEMNGIWQFLSLMLSSGLGFSLEENLLREIWETVISALLRIPSILSLYVPNWTVNGPLLLHDILHHGLQMFHLAHSVLNIIIRIFNITGKFLWNCS